jgi:hypothetical protein
MRGSRGRLAVRAIQLSALLVVAWFLYHALAGQVGQLSRADLLRWRPSGPALALSFVLLQIVYLAHALLWRTIVRDLELGDLSFRETIRVYFAAGLGKYVPGKVWALAGMAVLAGRAGLPPVASTAAAVLGQAAFMATGMVFLAVTLPGWQTELGGADGPASAILVIGLMLGGAALWLLAVSPAGHSLRERLATRLGERAGERIRATFRLADRITPRAAAAWALAYAATWVLIAASFVALVVAFVPDASVSVRYLAGTIAPWARHHSHVQRARQSAAIAPARAGAGRPARHPHHRRRLARWDRASRRRARSRIGPRIHVIHREGKLGLGTAYLDGFRWGLERGYAGSSRWTRTSPTTPRTCRSSSRPSRSRPRPRLALPSKGASRS